LQRPAILRRTRQYPGRNRKVMDLGVLTIDKAVPNSAEAEKKLLFMPGQLTDGIEESDDPLTARTLCRSRGAIHDQLDCTSDLAASG
jgi:catalase